MDLMRQMIIAVFDLAVNRMCQPAQVVTWPRHVGPVPEPESIPKARFVYFCLNARSRTCDGFCHQWTMSRWWFLQAPAFIGRL